MGFSVTVCCYHEYDRSMVEEMKQTGADVDLLEIDRAGGYFAIFRALRTYFKRNEPDAVHVRYIAPGLVPVLAAMAAGVKTVFVTVGHLGSPYGRLPKILIRITNFCSSCVICTAREIENSWFGSSKLFEPGINSSKGHCTIYNGIDIYDISEKAKNGKKQAVFREKYNIPYDKKLIAVVGRLRHEKGQIVALEAMSAIAAKMPETLLLLAGDGPDAEKLKEKTGELGIKNHVRFLGRLDIAEIFTLYGLSNCVLIPSIYEGFGLIAVEAMAAGLPVVASSVGGLKEIVADGGTGYLVQTSNSQEFAEKVVRILKSEELTTQMGEKGFQRAKEMFSYEAYSHNIKSLYSEYIKANK